MSLIGLVACDLRHAPSLWGPERTARAKLHCAPGPGWNAELNSALTARLAVLFPAAAPTFSPDKASAWLGGALRGDARRPGLSMLGHAVIALQSLSGAASLTPLTVARDGADTIYFSYGYEEASVARTALGGAIKIVNQIAEGATDSDLTSIVDAYAKRIGRDVSRLPALKALRSRDIPYRELDVSQAIVEAGWGCRRRRFHFGVTDRTSRIANEIASDKHLAARVMREHGIPVPRQFSVATLQEALAAARRIGYPVVAKPRTTDKGIAVSANLRSEASLAEAYEQARVHGPVIIETHLSGDHYRLVVIEDKVIAVSRLLPARVFGNGRGAVSTLIEDENIKRASAVGVGNPSRLLLSQETARLLADQELSFDAVPAPGQVVILRSASNAALGGTWSDVTHLSHPDNNALAVRAARAVGLDTAGVDFLCGDISRPYTETSGGVCEINPKPGLHGYHLTPDSPDLPAIYVNHLFPDSKDGRIPLIVMHGLDGRQAVSTLTVSDALKGSAIGVADRHGVDIAGRTIVTGPHDSFDGAIMVLADLDVEVAVLEVGGLDVARRGLAYDRATVCVLHGLDTRLPEPLRASVARLVADTARSLVANAADDAVVSLVGARPDVFWYGQEGRPEAAEALSAALAAAGGLV
jgi:cyanophycin synthetase